MTEAVILLVEDNPATRILVRYTLEQRGHVVIEAIDGHTALGLMERHRPSIVLLDLVLPDISGFRLVPLLRERAASGDSLIIAFSGLLSKREEAQLAAVGFDDVISKPVDPERLLAQVEAHLPHRVPESERFGAGMLALIADDDPLQLKLLRCRMKQLGFEVVTASDGQEALQIALRLKPDLIIADALMPRLDGFELSMAIREDDVLHALPVLLVTSSYIEAADRALARRSGATDLVVRTPDLGELVEALRRAFAKPVPSVPPEPIVVVEEERSRRVVKQLERQVYLNSGLAQRCAALSAELAVLTRISEVVLKNRSVDTALDEALAACFDAGGISVGALYHLHDGALQVRALGSNMHWSRPELEAFFGHEALLLACIDSGHPMHIPCAELPQQQCRSLLARCGMRDILIIPLAYLDQKLGALVMFAGQGEPAQPDWYTFARAIANQLAQVLALANALHARAKAEQLAQERTAFLDALLEQAPDFVMYVDPEGVVRYASRSNNSRVQDIVGESMFTLPSASSVDEQRKRLERVIARGESVSWEDTDVEAGVQTVYWCKMGPIRREGVVTGAVILARDISEKKYADAQLMAADRMISVGLLAAGVAHEINNPLSAVIAGVEFVSDQLKLAPGLHAIPREVLDTLHDTRDAGDRIRTIVRDLRVFSRAEEDKRDAVDVEHLLDSTLRMAWNEVRHRARLIKDFGGVPPVHACESRLGQVFLNLVVNATQAIPVGDCESHAIRISTSVNDEGSVVVRIADSGTGIPTALQSRVFSPFFTTKPAGVGTGLGLSICQRIVRGLGGTISFESQPGKGTEFQVKLPAARFPSQRPVPRSSLLVQRRGRVLVVDDEAIVAEALRRILCEDHEVVATGSAAFALELLRAGERFDVILCDLMMPQITGMQLHNELLTMDTELAARVVFLTGGAFTPWARSFLDSVNNHRLDKPFDSQSLRELVSRVIGGAQTACAMEARRKLQ